MKKLLPILLSFLLFAYTYRASGQTITGATGFCNGTTSALTGSPAGGTWSSSVPAVATIDASGIMTGTTPGTTTITYTPPSLSPVTTVVTVNSTPAAISGSTSLCASSVITMGNTVTGGAWSSSNISVATISALGNVSGIAAGVTTISYTLSNGCYASTPVMVNPLPAPVTSSTGTFSACTGSTLPLVDVTVGGTWSSGNLMVAAVSASGTVTGLSAGTAQISYQLPTGCQVTKMVTINSLPSPVTGTATVCAGSVTALLSFPTGGLWAGDNPSVAIIGPTSGVVTGIAAGTVNITYTTPQGCSAFKIVTVNGLPPAITGTTTICISSTTTLDNPVSGGIWSSSNPAVAPIDAVSGFIAPGSLAGTALISYTVPTGCITTTVVTVTPLPSPITGPATVCVGASSAFSSATPGGSWSSSAAGVATVSSATGSTALVTGVTAGITLISYSTGPGCTVSTVVTVSSMPFAGIISGPSVICIGTPSTLTTTGTGGAWTSSSPGVASVSGSGLVTAFGTGVATISYSVANVCGSDLATKLVSTNLPPAPIAGDAEICGGATTTLTESVPGGSWVSSDISVATIGSSSGIVSGAVSGGISIITYSFSSTCFVTRSVTIDPAPSAIGGVSPVCQGGVIALTNALAGGTWTSSNISVAIVSTLGGITGTVTGISPGTATITYGMVSGCYATAAVTVSPLPLITASASPSTCGGKYLASAVGGVSYLWFPSTGLSCDACASPVINPSGTTSYTVTGTSVLGCSSDAVVTVSGDRIYGHINFDGPAPSSLGMQVWLIQYSPGDSSVLGIDSMTTCLDGTTPFYEFDSKPAGSYMVRARLLSSVPGASGYVPTYGAGTANWYNAATIIRTGLTDSADINMIHATLPAGGCTITGNIYSGPDGTGGSPREGMLVYLKDAATGAILTYAYTNVLGTYSFTGVAYGTYIIYPENFSYYTTPSSLVILNEATPTVSNVHFKENTTSGTIEPVSSVGVATTYNDKALTLFPNPASGTLNVKWADLPAGNATLTIKDIMGREVLHTNISIYSGAGNALVDISALENGMYFFDIRCGSVTVAGKLLVKNQ